MTFEKPVIWSLFDAKAKFSALVEKARVEGPQLVTKHGEPAVVVLSVEDYNRLIQPRESFKDFLRRGPLDALDVERLSDGVRPVDL